MVKPLSANAGLAREGDIGVDSGSSLRGQLEVSHVSFSFTGSEPKDAQWTLRDISFSAEPNQFVALVGPSGCGKTTLLRLMAGMLNPTVGELSIDGVSLSSRRGSIGMVFQSDRLLPWRRVLENLTVILEGRGVSRAEARARAVKQLSAVNLANADRKYPHELSGGMRQRANLARALVIEPDVVLLDEPFAALDAQTREFMQAELLSIWRENMATVVMVTHQLDEAVYLADKVVVMGRDPGRVMSEIEIPFHRPRSLDLKHDPEFHRITDQVWRLIEGEVRSALMT